MLLLAKDQITNIGTRLQRGVSCQSFVMTNTDCHQKMIRLK